MQDSNESFPPCEENHTAISRLGSELFLNGLGRLPPDQFTSLAKKEFAFFFQDSHALDQAVKAGVILFDFAFYYNYFRGTIFELFLYRIIELYRQAKEHNQASCYELLGLWQSEIAAAHQNIACIARLEKSKLVGRLDLYAKTCFLELADIIEGTMKPHLQLLCGMSQISHSVSPRAISAELKHISLGSAVTQLIGLHEDFGIIYRDALRSVPLNQWRNIASHSAYFVTSNDKIECHYGKRDEQVVMLDRSGLTQIFIGIHHVGYMHKLAHNLFFCDNIKGLAPFLPVYKLADDTITIQIVESSYLHGYDVTFCKKTANTWTVTVRDNVGRSAEMLKSSCAEMIDLLGRITEGRITIDILSTHGRPTIRGVATGN